jgi:hypothetical protein
MLRMHRLGAVSGMLGSFFPECHATSTKDMQLGQKYQNFPSSLKHMACPF